MIENYLIENIVGLNIVRNFANYEQKFTDNDGY